MNYIDNAILIDLIEDYNAFIDVEYEYKPYTIEEFKQMINENEGLLYIAYTEDEDATPMQCVYDFKTCEYITLYGGEEKERIKTSLDDFIYDLRNASFDDFIRDCWKYTKED